MLNKIVTTTFTVSDTTVGYYITINNRTVDGGFCNNHIEAYKLIDKFFEDKESNDMGTS